MGNETKFAQPPYNTDIEDISFGENITIFVGEGAAPIAYVLNYDEFPCADEDQLDQIDSQAVATARLFAASPDLLKACQFALTTPGMIKGRIEMEKAVAKASGNAANREVSEK